MDRSTYSVCVGLILCLINVSVFAKEKCSKCVPAEECQTYRDLNKEDQVKWQERFVCQGSDKGDQTAPLGFAVTAKGDLVCCPGNVWGVESTSQANESDNEKKDNPAPDLSQRFGYQPNQYYNPSINSGSNYNGNGNNNYDDSDYNDYGSSGPYWQRRRKQTEQNPYFLPANSNGNSFRGSTSRGQCSVTSFPPDPATGCCGLEASEDDSVNSSPSSNTQYQQPYNSNSGRNSWMPQMNLPMQGMWPSWMTGGGYERRKRQAPANVTVGNRIAGGKETDLEQFPWTVLLKTTFVYPTKEAAFACGGSLISSRYVLTAGHCVYDAEGTIKEIEATLAEYDKRTFPKDCKLSLGRGEVCIENIIMKAESYVLHPEYDDNRLYNDIALVRLQGIAPYTRHIRPICLPPIDIDSPELSNLRLAVAGWGRNGQYKSDIKQSTVVNLVPQGECRKSYPSLTRKQVCAAGYSGEDTCKGDSGGPLMIKHNGKYYVSGVVSGKRADAPCGTSVPSLYTNVYQYVPWIKSVIQN